MVTFVLLSLMVSSCYTYKNISRKDPITNEFLSNLKPGKRYLFDLNTGKKQIIYLTGVGQDSIKGYFYEKGSKTRIDYAASFERVEKDVAKLSVRKRNPYLTGGLVLSIVATATVIIWSIAVVVGLS